MLIKGNMRSLNAILRSPQVVLSHSKLMLVPGTTFGVVPPFSRKRFLMSIRYHLGGGVKNIQNT